MQKAMKTENGIKSVMSVLAEEERKNSSFVAALASTPNVPAPPIQQQIQHPQAQPQVSALSTACPATSVRLTSILRNRN